MKVPVREITNQNQAKSGTATPKKRGPAAGNKGIQNPTKSGGIFRPTKGQS
jgi:hypothetical protein